MPFNPIAVLDEVTEEYKGYIKSEFRARDPVLRQRLNEALERDRFLCREPFFQAHRPFATGAKWRDLPLDSKFATVMEDRAKGAHSKTWEHAYTHQSKAIAELLSPTPRPVVVTTGTGSGKTEAFLLPVLQNALLDSRAFEGKPGLTAVLVYPMNALANDQRERIAAYLGAAGLEGAIRVEQYDRSSSQEDRQRMRDKPPHILLTNYMMLEYLLVRPADRDAIFANHRCRFLVLDEVHSYRGSLGANIALLVRRLRAHLQSSRQDWNTEPAAKLKPLRFPAMVPVGTSATIKSVDEGGGAAARDEAVREFFSRLTGVEDKASIQVFGEELQQVPIPADASYTPEPVAGLAVDPASPDSVHATVCKLAGVADSTHVEEAARKCRLLWDINHWLVKAPLSLDQIIDKVCSDVPARKDADREGVTAEVHAALLAGTALPEETPNILRLRAHRFFRGGWRFHRCLNADCGHLQAMGEDKCSVCQSRTAPLLLCRSCGADAVVLEGDPSKELWPAPITEGNKQEGWLVYEPDRFHGMVSDGDGDEDTDEGDEQPAPTPKPAKGKKKQATAVIHPKGTIEGKLNWGTLEFSGSPDAPGTKVFLTRSFKRCLCCGGTSGSHDVITRVEMGTSAAVKVLSESVVEALHEANKGAPGHDGKERLLIFADSRQDAAHQARFIEFTSRYDRMRQRVYSILKQHGPLKFQDVVGKLVEQALQHRDNPHVPKEAGVRMSSVDRDKAHVWEEAPLLDQLAANANYRGTLVNLGMLAVRYLGLEDWVKESGKSLAERFGITLEQLTHICRCLLDDMRTHSAFKRPLMVYHPAYASYKDELRASKWERSVKSPAGYACGADGRPVAKLDPDTVASGIRVRNIAREGKRNYRPPGSQRVLETLVKAFGGATHGNDDVVDVVDFLRKGAFVQAVDLYGFQKSHKLLQVNADEVELALTDDATRVRCGTCLRPLAGAAINAPCPSCATGRIAAWPAEHYSTNRAVSRVQQGGVVPLFAGEHTAQVPTEARRELEEEFKRDLGQGSKNVLACSPTLEMGIDVGGLEAVVMRNIPPRPDNYAQRGGRAGRRARIGLVISYARRRPHDQYFYDHPAEMIAGEVPAPTFSLENRDVLMRHVAAIAFGAAEPGLSGRMADYITTNGDEIKESVAALKAAVAAKAEHARDLAWLAFGKQLTEAGLTKDKLTAELGKLGDRIQDVIDRTRRQVTELRQTIVMFSEKLNRKQAAGRAADLIKRLLGIPLSDFGGAREADDWSAGYPLRRFAEFGVLPGYAFPTEPASLRLLSDEYEDEPITTARRFGIGQFQPSAPVFARAKRWKVSGIDRASPWNPQSTDEPSWRYMVCPTCELRYRVPEHQKCPRCGNSDTGAQHPAFEYGGFVAKREEAPVMQEEDRYAARDLVRLYPQRSGALSALWTVCEGWRLELRRGERVDWLNEGPVPRPKEVEAGLMMHGKALGYLPCSSCGALLNPAPSSTKKNPFGHLANCPQIAQQPTRVSIGTSMEAETLRLIVPVPTGDSPDDSKNVLAWTWSLAESLIAGARHRFMLDHGELDLVIEGPWLDATGDTRVRLVSVSIIDPTVGGSGYLQRIAEQLHGVAEDALAYLDHDDCDTACYRCLKSYSNQRQHELLHWPLAVPALQALAEAAPTSQALNYKDDPRPWLEAYDAGMGSPLEVKFWKLFEKHGFAPARQVDVRLVPDGPVVSVADFGDAVKRVAIYVDGASVHVGHRLRRDHQIRQRMREVSSPWEVIELSASDLQRGVLLVENLRSQFGQGQK